MIWMNSLWYRGFIVLFPRLIKIFFIRLPMKSPAQFLKPSFLPSFTFCYIKIKHLFINLVHFCQTQIVPPLLFYPYVYHICCPLHMVFRSHRSMKYLPPTFFSIWQYFNHFNSGISFSCGSWTTSWYDHWVSYEVTPNNTENAGSFFFYLTNKLF